MSDYIVSARKYRPATFDAVVGQSALTTTLKNAIKAGKLAHAYLFCGPRGVGKTTSARIFAKTINCLSPGQDGEACDKCESCMAFNEGRSLNIHELDAASNNSVDDIRTLIEQVQIPPQAGRYKVFIIDEVHMLSAAAFNAFLKTLEEPPAHAIFILATTEKHKILPTILSRCQIYDFNRMEVEDIVGHLKRVAEREGYACEDEALNVIAQKADGGMRDALSIFDQIASYTQGNITYSKVIENLNILDYDYYFNITDCLLKCDVTQVMLTLNDILCRGFEANHFMGGLSSHFRNLLVSRDAQTLPLLEVAQSVQQRYQEQAMRCSTKFIYRALKLCNNCDINYRTARNKRLLVEITLIEVAQLMSENADDSASGGRSPIRRLLPIFAPVATPAATTPHHPTATVRQTPTIPQPRTTVTTPKTTVGVAVQANPAPQSALSRRLNTISISTPPKGQTAASGTHIATATAANASTTSRETTLAEPFNEDELRYYWLRFVNELPPEQSAEAGRLQMLKPQIMDNFVVEVSVDNERVAKHLGTIKENLTGFLRDALHNSLLTIKFKVNENVETHNYRSPREILQDMCKANKAVALLVEKLKLQLA